VYAETPVRIEYELTEKGHALQSTIACIQGWSDEWINEPQHSESEEEVLHLSDEDCEKAAAGTKAE